MDLFRHACLDEAGGNWASKHPDSVYPRPFAALTQRQELPHAAAFGRVMNSSLR